MVYLSLGSNQGDRLSFLRMAIQHIDRELGSIRSYSSIYETEAWGKTDQQDFYNAVISVKTEFEPKELLKKIKQIEKTIGRNKTEKWGPRNIDIDILIFNDQIIETKNLTIPHSKLHLRNFALIPLIEIAPQLQHPKYHKILMDLYLDNDDESEVVKLNDIHLDSC